jgi:hypothetical protein
MLVGVLAGEGAVPAVEALMIPTASPFSSSCCKSTEHGGGMSANWGGAWKGGYGGDAPERRRS